MKKKIYWRPSRLIEDPLTGNTYVLMYGGSGRVRYITTSEIQDPVFDENRFKEKSDERRNSQHQ